ncbi:DUF438 domain-containing protein [Chitinispirillales bacterium ANBcel5]|uniref:DUF438 domain-containing protein n=1 Tax=Cellulosispirillum alkaliphilum TaxID=3039283 RepID=UPI002A53B8B6|nr:DUF438 domain-containing protein [Chitinispirillales bacterium ANBcel5]
MMPKLHKLDARGLSHEEKQQKLFPMLNALGKGDQLRVVFDFDPEPLLYMLTTTPGIGVRKDKKGPEEWILEITKQGETQHKENETMTRETLKSLLRELRSDNVTEETKQRAKKLLNSVDAMTLGMLEQELIQEGVSHQEIRESLCDIHLEAMRDALVEKQIEVSAPHPVHTLMEEHRLIVSGLHKIKEIVGRLETANSFDEMGNDFDELKEASHLLVEAELHHQREEEALFPKLHQYNITEPPHIMEEEHVEFRARKRALFGLVCKGQGTPFSEFKKEVLDHGEFITRELENHIFKEDNILYQIALQMFTEQDWKEVKEACDKIGYCCFKPQDQVPFQDLDLRPLPPRERHDLIFEQWGALPSGGVLRITNDHDPKPLYYQFQAEHGGQFSWEYELQGPEDWVVKIGHN